MIQRIQSVLLFLAAILNLGIYMVPAWKFSEGSSVESLTALQSVASVEGGERAMSYADTPLNLLPGALAVVASLLILFIIFQYKNRKLQISLSNVAVILLMLQLAAWVFITMKGPLQIGNATGESSPWIGFAFPVVAMILTWLGRTYIAKDEKLVRSSERFR
jgi:glucan phosphoethanolaminetransferase (alkaline phosphatase superfamily)